MNKKRITTEWKPDNNRWRIEGASKEEQGWSEGRAMREWRRNNE
jgi:hypothetical protein